MLTNTMGNGRPEPKRAGGLRSLWRDRRGTVAIYVAISMPMLLGIGALSIDLGRLMSVNTDLQSAADAAAMAGAKELDQTTGSRDRARATAAGAVANLQTFATGGADVTIDTTDCADPPVAPCIRFLKELPNTDDAPIKAQHVAASDKEARYIDVHVATRTVTNGLIRLVGGPATASTSATAVAGQQYVICGIPLMFMCNPSEPDGNTDLELPVDATLLEGKQLEMFHQGGGGSLSPGNFGLICPAGTENDTNCGANEVKKAIASASGHCAALVTTKTGVTMSAIRAGINARFDYWTGQAEDDNGVPWRDQDIFAPAANVTQGGEMNVKDATRCEYKDLNKSEAMGLPRDQCHIDDDCDDNGAIAGNPRVGDGNWDYRTYFRINHGCDLNSNASCKPSDWGALTLGAWPPTRYEVYRYELERTPEEIVMPGQTIYDASGNPVDTTAENGHTQCFQGTPPAIPGYNYYPAKVRDLTLLTDRRVMPFAVMNCNALEAAGIDTGGQFTFDTDDLAYVFLTEPINKPSDAELYGEFLGPLDDGATDSLKRIMLQLYRRS